MSGPVHIRTMAGYVGLTLRMVNGYDLRDTRTIHVCDKGSPDDLALVARLRVKLAKEVARCIREDDWKQPGGEEG